MNRHFFLGNSQIKVYPVGLGTAFSETEYKNPQQIKKIIQQAIDLGINFIDTGENYGDGLSEKIIGRSLIGKRSKIILATKFSPEHSSYQTIIDSCHQSLKRLKTNYIDLYQFHWPNPKIDIQETIKGLNFLIKEGSIRFIGAGNFSVREFKFLISSLGREKVLSIQAEFNLPEQTIIDNGLLDFCQNNSLSLISYSPLDQGRKNLTPKQSILIDQLTKKYHANLSQIILAYLIKHNSVLPIPKTINSKHLMENFNSIKINLEKPDYDQITKSFKLKTQLIPTSKITVTINGERNRQVYQTIAQAIANKFNFVPGPMELAQSLKKDPEFRPVRLVKNLDKKSPHQYILINGRIRYWAWVLAFGKNKPIPSYIRD